MQSARVAVFFALSLLPICVYSQESYCTLGTPLGCYTDQEVRALEYAATTSDSTMSHSVCGGMCHDKGYTLAGVEDGVQCFCGNQINPASNATKTPDSDCSTTCSGNSTETCGGIWRLYIAKIVCGTAIPSYQGCLDTISQSFQYCNTSLDYEARVQDLMSHMTLQQKITAITPQPDLGSTCESHTGGVDSLGLGSYAWLVETNTGVASHCMAEGRCSTTFSGPMGMAASFNRTSWTLKGSVFGTEMRAYTNSHGTRGSGMLIGLSGYGPNINIARDPRFGRNSELAGEDPFLAGTYAASMVAGMQEEDSNGHPKMLALLKHFDAYSSENNRGHDNYNISPHDLWETYLAQYELAFTSMKTPPTGVMCSYNGVNGNPACANNMLLNQVLRSWYADALVTTDCGAVSNLRGPPVNAPDDTTAAAYAVNNGTDIEMGSTVLTDNYMDAIKKGLTSEAVVNASFRRAFLPLFRAGRFDPVDSVAWSQFNHTHINSPLHQQIQYEAATQSLVLLKNSNSLLPLAPGTKIAILGPQGQAQYGLLSDYFGDDVCFGGGYACIPTIADRIASRNGGAFTLVAKGVDVNSNDASSVQEALDLVNFVDVVILAMGIDKNIEQEGQDRTDTALPGLQQPFAEMVIAMGKPTVLLLTNGGALAIDSLMDATAIVEAFNPSLAGAQAIADTLFGFQNRWGKLPVTMYPHNYITQQPMANYDMSVAPGRTYKYYTGSPLFPFGFGQSYSTFSLACSFASNPSHIALSCGVTNTSPRNGEEVVLVYHSVGADIRKSAQHPVPIKALVDFQRVAVASGATTNASFALNYSVLNLINEKGDTVLYPGTHYLIFSRGVGQDVQVTVSVKDSPSREVTVSKEFTLLPEWKIPEKQRSTASTIRRETAAALVPEM